MHNACRAVFMKKRVYQEPLIGWRQTYKAIKGMYVGDMHMKLYLKTLTVLQYGLRNAAKPLSLKNGARCVYSIFNLAPHSIGDIMRSQIRERLWPI